ncbi:MAG: hypothetical protein GKR99_05380 [Rhodobacteraceae bacterium]|nr:hypothetical protein [Paracoccaceae bacterium]
MNRIINATIIALYATAIPLLAGLNSDTVERLVALSGIDAAQASGEAVPVSDAQAIEMALAATRANHKPAPLTRFAPFMDAEIEEGVTVLASLN